MDARTELVRKIVEECWTDAAGLDRMGSMVSPGYVHHTAFGDWDFAQFRAGVDYVESLFTQRRYHLVHTVDDGRIVAAFLERSGVRRADGCEVTGRGAYHCRIESGLITEDWDAFFPSA